MVSEMLNVLDLSLFEFFDFLMLFFIIFTALTFLLHRRNIKKISKRAKKRSSISVSVRRMKKDDKAKAIMSVIWIGLMCLVTSTIFFQQKYCDSRLNTYSEALKIYEETVKLKNEQTDRISTDCMLIVENSKSRLEDIDKLVEDLKNNYYSLQVDYENCQMEKNDLKEELGKMPFIEAVKPFEYSHTYDIRFFNCADFSLGAINIIRDYGYDAYIRTVRVNCSALGMNCEGTGLHAIVVVEVPFEATGFFEPISPKDFEAYGL